MSKLKEFPNKNNFEYISFLVEELIKEIEKLEDYYV